MLRTRKRLDATMESGGVKILFKEWIVDSGQRGNTLFIMHWLQVTHYMERKHKASKNN